MDDITEPLPNGAELPEHPATTTARTITEYGNVWDDADGRPLGRGMHENEIKMLMGGEKGGLSHLYLYAIRNKHIYHTRPLVVIDVKCRETE